MIRAASGGGRGTEDVGTTTVVCVAEVALDVVVDLVDVVLPGFNEVFDCAGVVEAVLVACALVLPGLSEVFASVELVVLAVVELVLVVCAPVLPGFSDVA